MRAALMVVMAAAATAGLPVDMCATRWFTQPVNHFSFSPAAEKTYKQRVLTYFGFWKKSALATLGGPVFFYFGNEADVELYVDHSGLMWEHAQRFGAGLVFAEHRYYGRSVVDDDCSMQHLTTEQALADFAVVITQFRSELAPSAVIGFGGSYGGMLATLFRFKYPHLVDGVIAASAPVLAYLGMGYDPNAFARVVTHDAGPQCAAVVKAGLAQAFNHTKTASGRLHLSTVFKTCKPLKDANEAAELIAWAGDHWNYLAMGMYPYPSTYVQPEGGLLPAWPVDAACKLATAEPWTEPVRGVAAAAFMFYNATLDKPCFFNGNAARSRAPLMLAPKRGVAKPAAAAATAACNAGSWDWQWCTEHLMPFTQGTARDMFYPPSGFDLAEAEAGCAERWGAGAVPRANWALLAYGGLRGLQRGLSNVVFSNGLKDPWSAGGVLSTHGFDQTVLAVRIPNGGHHVDLMFADDKHDTPDIQRARDVELDNIARWIRLARWSAPEPEAVAF